MNSIIGPATAAPRHRSAGLGFAVLALVLAILPSSPGFAQAVANRLEAVDVTTLPGQQVQLKLRTSGPAPVPLSFTIDKPARISLDLPGVSLALTQRRIDVKSGNVDSIVAGEASGRTRLVLNMDSLVPYDTRVDGNTIIVTVGAARGGTAAAASAASTAAAPAAADRRVSAIDFRRAPDGTGRVTIALSDPRTPVNLRQEGQQVVVDFVGAKISTDLVKRYDVVDFATPVTYVDALKVDANSRLVINAQGDYEQLAYQTDNQYVVEIRRAQPSAKGAAPDDKKEYTGERLTLNFQDIDVRAVLQLLADTSGQNIVVSDTVSGAVTLRLQNVPWDQALDIVMRTKGLAMRRRDNVILVGPADELAKREKDELQARKEVQELAPLRTEYLQVNYAKATDLATLIKGKTGNSLISTRGSVAIDERTNTLLLQDTADRLADIRRLVATLDIPVRQVLIESRVVIVNDDFSRQLGVRLGMTGVKQRGSNGLVAISGTATSNNTIVSSALTNLQAGNPAFPVQIPTASTGSPSYLDRYNVNLPVTPASGSIALSVLSGNYLVDLELSAAQAEDRAEIVSAPRVITSNQKEAIIEQGVEIPYQESSSSGATTTQFKKAVLSLKVKPQITPDNRVIMDLTVSKDNVGQLVQSATGGQVPSIDTRTITTQVLVNDGQTVVLGGIMETEKRTTDDKVPVLGDIPILGYLFKTRTRTNNKDELLIFVTPKILREGANLY
ncbi:MAG TPA: type IV pilus secretin PilQ [Steroidobacteraceae bacterium]|nr:type IV pilus secretin PilQ [Steroidobacteraceae bacterium]